MPLSNLKQINSKKGSATMAAVDSKIPGEFSEENRHLMIAQAAYFRALERGFEAGHEEEDWYAAETEIEQATGQ